MRHGVFVFFAGKEVKLVRDLVFVEGCGTINDEAKEKLGFLNTTCSSLAV
jgi:hypothetical protein